MRFLLSVTILLALGWGGYWFVGSNAAKLGFESWFEDRRKDGWVADYAGFELRGFPNRFDASFTGISIADPETGLAWGAPFFQILSLSYQPNHVIAVWPDKQLLATPHEKYDITSADMRSSLVLEPKSDLAFDRATLTAQGMRVSPVGQSTSAKIGSLTLAAEQVPADEMANYRLGLAVDGFAPSIAWRRHVDPNNRLPDTLDNLTADLTVLFDKPWDRFAIEQSRPQPQEIHIKLAQANWGQLSLAMAGSVKIDSMGRPTGTLTIKIKNWREILAMAQSSGMLSDGVANTMEDGLALISRLAGNPKTLDVPLEFAKGRIWLGPVPIAPSSDLRLR